MEGRRWRVGPRHQLPHRLVHVVMRREPSLVECERLEPVGVLEQQPVGRDHEAKGQLVLGAAELELVRPPDAVRAVVGEQEEDGVLQRETGRHINMRGAHHPEERSGRVCGRGGIIACRCVGASRSSIAASTSSSDGSRSMKCSCATIVLTDACHTPRRSPAPQVSSVGVLRCAARECESRGRCCVAAAALRRTHSRGASAYVSRKLSR